MDHHNATSNMNISVNGGGLGDSIRGWTRSKKQHSGSHETGIWTGKTIIAFLVVCVMFLLLIWFIGMIADAISLTSGASLSTSAAIYASLMHNKCKGRGGCSRKCPFITESDPRVVMENQVQTVEQLLNMLVQTDKAESDLLDKEDNTQAIQDLKTKCIENVKAILSELKKLDKIHGEKDVLDAASLRAKMVMTGLQLAADLNKNAFVAAVAASNTSYMMKQITNKAAKNAGLDKEISLSKSHEVPIQQLYKDITNKFTSAEPTAIDGSTVKPIKTYDAIVAELINDSYSSNEDLDYIAVLLNVVKKEHTLVDSIMAKYAYIATTLEKMKDSFESFNNDLPGKIGSREVSALIESGDYDAALLKTALEPEVLTNHKKFAKERATFDSGGGVPSVLDHDNNLVQWVGLFGRPTYRRSDGSSADKSSEPLRAIPSDNPEDLMRSNTPKLSFA